ncbi:MAG: prepilin peptidase [Lentisphaerae bacterium]|nr:prepilin peptidase [Lentisphaerota bacterium]
MDPMIVFSILAFAWGACAGSFANVCIHRMPRGLSVVMPRSHCTSCGRLIPGWLNIPIVSYLMLGGKCRFCRARISVRYMLVELFTGQLFLAIFLKFSVSVLTLVYWLFALGLIIGSFVDFEHMIIPDRITIGGMVAGPILSLLVPGLHGTVSRYSAFCSSLIGLVAGAFFLLGVAMLGSFIFKKEAMGMGDVKLLGAIGAFLGWQSIPFVITVSSLVGSIVGISLILIGGRKLGSKMPFGPYIAIGALLWILGGQVVWAKYVMYFSP